MSDMTNTIKKLTTGQRPSSQPSNWARNELEFNILIAGGHDGKVYLNSSEMFDSATKTWQMLGSMKESRLAPSAFVYQNNIIVAGGFNGDSSTNRMEGRISFHVKSTCP